MVFRRVRGKTVIAQRPIGSAREISPAQQAQRERFAQAGEYARQVLSDPCQRRIYERLARERNRRPDSLVMSDFLTVPTIDEIDVSAYQRQAGGLIRILAFDDIEVVAVEAIISTAAGALVERGPATKVQGVWCYRTTTDAPAGEAVMIEVRAWDRPGHSVSRTIRHS
jgi:hypothetical protein